jgi:diguanylate cyclase (GGDEF)-like protein
MRIEERPATQNKDPMVLRLILAAVAVVLFTLGAGVLLQSKINRLIEARDWSEHSLDVQANLQALLIRIDRYDSLVNLYLIDRMPGRLRESQNLGVSIESSARQIANLVSDNRSQDQNARRLNECAFAIASATRALESPTAGFPTAAEVTCREVTVLMQQQERNIAASRSKATQHATLSLLVVGFSLACFAILVVLALFGVLIRDALFRRRSEEQLSASNNQLATTIQVLEDKARETAMLSDARDELQMCLSVDEACQTAVHFVDRIVRGSTGALCMIDNSRQTIERRSSWGGGGSTLEAFPIEACCGMRGGQSRWCTPESSVLHCAHFEGVPPERYICMPLVAHGDTLGVLCIECTDREAARRADLHLPPLHALLQLTSMTVAAINLRSKLENQSIRDSLTGLFNRHFMEITLEREIRRATRRDNSMAVLMIDADNFKQFNDTFGHKAGDTVLRSIADRFLSSVRSEDIVCRYGGEEFVIILPDISLEKAAERAENIREAINSLRVTDNGNTLGAVTVSIGVAVFPQDGRSIEALLQASDRSLYAAKKYGRNQVILAAEAAHLPVAAK